ncbi:MAG: hypothetical protein HY901_25780 [Deltaproteobacteria bacterium]|nr:hypothetical protein [Deltaproteobacteria bacterium]
MRPMLIPLVALAVLPGCQCCQPTDESLFSLRQNQLSAGGRHTCQILAGALYCWGGNTDGQLGLGTTTEAEPPSQVGHFTDWQSVSAGTDSTCAIRQGALSCWGGNRCGEVGDGTTATRSSPVDIPGSWSTVKVGGETACAISTDNRLFCWGDNSEGKLGDGSDDTSVWFRSTPGRVAGSWKAVAVSPYHVCGIQTDSSLWCWGGGLYGELGIGSVQANQTLPVRVGTEVDWADVKVSNHYSCAFKVSGERYCFGTDQAYSAASFSPTLVSDTAPWALFELGGAFPSGCGIRKNGGGLWCWGSNVFGMLGVGDAVPDFSASPVLVDADPGWVSVAVGDRHACAVKADSQHHPTRYCWGGAVLGQFGQVAHGPQRVVGNDWSAVAVGSYGTLGLHADGSLAYWGLGAFPSCGRLRLLQVPQPIPGNQWTAVAVARDAASHGCGLTTKQELLCWGGNDQGQLGLGISSDYVDVPTRVRVDAELLTLWKQVSTGSSHTCAIRDDGTLWCWGGGDLGQLGDGLAQSNPAPTRVDQASWTAVSVGGRHTCGLHDDGTLWCWGANESGQLGVDGSDTTPLSSTPMQVGTATWASIAAGDFHTCGRQADASLWCWGGTSAAMTPVRVGADSDWIKVVAGDARTCGLRAPGTRWCWGSGLEAPGTATPQQQDSETSWTSLALGAGHDCGRRSDGSLWCWGSDESGALGTGNAWHASPQEL